MLTIEEFGKTIKQKYPQYGGLSDLEIGQKTLEKYPEYQSKVSQLSSEEERPTEGIWDAFKRGGTNIKESIKESGKELDETLNSDLSTSSKLYKTASGLVTGIAEPLIAEPVSTIMRAGGEAIQSATGYDINEATSKGVNWLVKKGMDNETAKEVMEGYKYIKETDPEKAAKMDAALNVAEFLGYFIGAKGAKGLKTKGSTLSNSIKEKVVNVASPIIDKADDLITKGKEVAVPMIEKGTRFGVAQTSGLNPETVSTILKKPERFSKSKMIETDREKVFNQAKNAIDQRMKDLSETGKGYEAMKALPDTVPVSEDFITSILKERGINIDKKGKIKVDLNSDIQLEPADIKGLDSILNVMKGKTELSVKEVLNLRTRFSNLAGFAEGKTGASKLIAKELRKKVDNVAKNIPGLRELDEQFSTEIGQLKEVKNLIYDKAGNLKSNAIQRIATLTGKNKEIILAKVEKMVPGITEEINILKAIEDITTAEGHKVGTYMRSGMGLGGAITGTIAGGPVGGVIGGAIGFILNNPSMAVELLRQYSIHNGVPKQMFRAIVSKMKTGKKLIGSELEVMNKAVDDASKSTIEKLKNIKPGMTIEDVSKKGNGEIRPTKEFNNYFKNWGSSDKKPKAPSENVIKEARKEVDSTKWFRGQDKYNAKSGDSFYSASKDVAGDFGKVSPIKNKPKNPLVISSKDELAQKLGFKGDPTTTSEFDSVAKRYAQENGHDSIMYRDGTLGESELHVFKSQPLQDPLIQEAKKGVDTRNREALIRIFGKKEASAIMKTKDAEAFLSGAGKRVDTLAENLKNIENIKSGKNILAESENTKYKLYLDNNKKFFIQDKTTGKIAHEMNWLGEYENGFGISKEKWEKLSLQKKAQIETDWKIKEWYGNNPQTQYFDRLDKEVGRMKGLKTTNEISQSQSLQEGVDSLIQEARKVETGNVPIYHGTPEKFSKFDTNRMEGGQAWFTTSKKDITSGTAGAVQGQGQKLNIMERYVKPGAKFADEKTAEKYYTDQLIEMGYAGKKVEQDGAIWYSLFDPNKNTSTKPFKSQPLQEGGVKVKPKVVVKPYQKTNQLSSKGPKQGGFELLDRMRNAGEQLNAKLKNEALSGQREHLRLKGDDIIEVYRAANKKIGIGDQITTSKANAQKYLGLREDSFLQKIKVKKSDLVKAEGLSNEFIYAPKSKLNKNYKGSINKKVSLSGAGIGAAALGVGKLPSKKKTILDRTSEEKPKEQTILDKKELSIDDFNLKPYATSKDHISRVKEIYNSLSGVKSAEDINKDVDRISKIQKKESPLKGKGEFIKNIAKECEVPINLLLAAMRQDTTYGIYSKSKNNPGNIGNNDSGKKVDFDTIEDGIKACAEYLAKLKK